jgi:protein-L-isoaspartate(D-aspartate) O-methyltransferase
MQTEQARFNMIEQQIRPWNLADDDVLAVMLEIPRERFVPEAYRQLAFADTDIPLAHGQHMLAPKIEAHLLQALQIKPGDKVLEIGTGSGYLTACLSWLSGNVTSLELFADLSASAELHLQALNIQAHLLVQDAFLFVPTEPFDVIAVTGSLPIHSNHFEQMLAIDGRLFQVTGVGAASQAERVVRLSDNQFKRETLFETAIDALLHAPQPTHFTF